MHAGTMEVSNLVLLPTLLARAAGVEPPVSKASFSLLSPTPREAMREMTADRPDVTETPFTVDAGHVQLEMDALSSELDAGATELWAASTNVRLGLTNSAEVQLLVEPWRHVEGLTGFGDLTLRGKLSLWGNDGGPTALSALPFVRLPTARTRLGTGKVEGGLLLPLGVELPDGWGLSTMLGLDVAEHADHYGAELIATGSLEHDLVGDLGGYLELASSLPLDEPDQVELAVNGGLVLRFGDDLAIDAGTRVGLSEAAADLALFVGGSVRH